MNDDEDFDDMMDQLLERDGPAAGGAAATPADEAAAAAAGGSSSEAPAAAPSGPQLGTPNVHLMPFEPPSRRAHLANMIPLDASVVDESMNESGADDTQHDSQVD